MVVLKQGAQKRRPWGLLRQSPKPKIIINLLRKGLLRVKLDPILKFWVELVFKRPPSERIQSPLEGSKGDFSKALVPGLVGRYPPASVYLGRLLADWLAGRWVDSLGQPWKASLNDTLRGFWAFRPL